VPVKQLALLCEESAHVLLQRMFNEQLPLASDRPACPPFGPRSSLARDVTRRLREDCDIEDPVIVERFAPRPRVRLRARIERFFRGSR
jgi:hypothetical protein